VNGEWFVCGERVATCHRDFWATTRTRSSGGDAAAGTAEHGDAGRGRLGGDSATPSLGASASDGGDDGGGGAMHVVRYAARGHGDSSPASGPADCTWEALVKP
jgi:hypothetical protein